MSEAIGYVPVQLPSRGVLYGGKVPDGTVHIRKLKVGEEAAIQSATSGMELVSAVVSTAVKLPEGMSHLDLLMTDRLALLIALRVNTFGRVFPLTFRCPVCGHKTQADIDLGTALEETPADPGLTEPMTLTLPDCGKSVGLRFLRGKDEATIARMSKQVAMKNNDPGSSSHILRLALQIQTIDAVELSLDKREDFVRDLTMVDSQAIQDFIAERESGVDISFTRPCSREDCGTEVPLQLPFTADFFRASRHTAGRPKAG